MGRSGPGQQLRSARTRHRSTCCCGCINIPAEPGTAIGSTADRISKRRSATFGESGGAGGGHKGGERCGGGIGSGHTSEEGCRGGRRTPAGRIVSSNKDRKSTSLNSSHLGISY